MSYKWSYKSDGNKENVIAAIYAMKWNTAQPTYDWMVQLTAGPETAYSKVMLELQGGLSVADRAAIQACEKNRMELANKVREVPAESSCFNCWGIPLWP